MAGLPGMAGDRQGQRHRMAEGLDVSTEQKRDGDAVMLCVHAGRREPSEKKKTKGEKKKKKGGNKRGQHHKEAGQKRTSGWGHATALGD